MTESRYAPDPCYRVLPWREEPFFEPCEYVGRAMLVHEFPDPAARRFDDPTIPLPEEPPARSHVLKRHWFGCNGLRWVVYAADADARLPDRLALLALGLRLLDFIAHVARVRHSQTARDAQLLPGPR